MTTVAVHRPARTVVPPAPLPTLQVESPPNLPEGSGGPGLQTLLPMAGVGASMTVMLVFRGSSFAAIGAIVLVASLLGALVFTLSSRGKATRERRRLRGLYLDYLERLRDRAADEERAWRAAALLAAPAPDTLVDLVRFRGRLWERRGADPDFLALRVGTGTLPVRQVAVADSGTAVSPADPFMLAEARTLRRRFGRLPGAPVTVPLDRAGDVSVVGDRDDVDALARLVVGQAAALHPPDDVRIAVVTDRPEAWAWVRWLPHAVVPGPIGRGGPQALVAPTPAGLAALLADFLATQARAAASAARRGGGRAESATRPRFLVVADGWGAPARPLPLPDPALTLADLGGTVLHLCRDRLDEPGEVGVRVTVDGTAVTVEAPVPGPEVSGTLDRWTAAEAEGLARALSPARLSPDSYDDGTGSAPADFPSLLGLDPHAPLDLPQRWAPRGERDFLRVPIGVDLAGRAVRLDLKESSQLGMGPHGMCVGAIGSGKSELLRTLVLGLVLTHPPEDLAVVLIDYKGGAAFSPFAGLPHLAGLITNLLADEALIERAYASLDGEVRRRQELLAAVGAVDITEYGLRRDADPALEPLPHLLVVVDEFAELITAKPDFAELFLRIGRIGRSIGVHLLLSSQRVESGKLRGLDTYLSYRLGLRTFSELESRTVIDTPDAFHLPAVPGSGWLKVDVSVYTQFKTAYVSGPLDDAGGPADEPTARPGTPVQPLGLFGALPAAEDEAAVRVATPRVVGPTLLGSLVAQVAASGAPRVRDIWLPPLPAVLGLADAAGGWRVTAEGVRLDRPAHPDRLLVPIGRLDDPVRQWQDTWEVDLDDGAGHLLVLGGPRSGTSSALATVVLGLATTRSPDDVAVYGIDLDGGALRPLAALPHVGSVAGREDPELVRRTIEELGEVVAARETLFRDRGWTGPADLRAARAAGGRGLPPADVVLVVDGWAALMTAFEPLADQVGELLTRGGRVGLHVVASARRWNEVRMRMQPAFTARVELRLAEPAESSIEARAARALPQRTPGRGLTTDSLVGQVALPALVVPPRGEDGLEEACRLVAGTWTGAAVPPVRVLPRVLGAADLLGDATPWRVPLGRAERDHAPVVWDLEGAEPHLLVLGDSGSGKTNLARLAAGALAARHGEDDVVFAVYDPRRGLRGAVPDELEGGYADTVGRAAELTAAICTELARRSDAPDGPAPRIVVVVDDYDVLAASSTPPLDAFRPYLASARDLRLSFLLTRRVMGAARGLYEPLVSGLRESGAALLLMSGDPSEGQLLPGLRPRTLPPGRGRLVRPGVPEVVVQTALAAELP
ncbi:type VII secretion protein EccCa [Blastococcus sp. SYSU D00813]